LNQKLKNKADNTDSSSTKALVHEKQHTFLNYSIISKTETIVFHNSRDERSSLIPAIFHV
jgi:hypothetical protein